MLIKELQFESEMNGSSTHGQITVPEGETWAFVGASAIHTEGSNQSDIIAYINIAGHQVMSTGNGYGWAPAYLSEGTHPVQMQDEGGGLTVEVFVLQYVVLENNSTSVTEPAPDTPDDPAPEEPVEGAMWTGDKITFTKLSGRDPALEENQDRITDNVWITRGNDGGQIFNYVSEGSADSDTSPEGTEWAQGDFSGDLESLMFTPFREACPSNKPKNAVGIPFVVHLIQDDIYLELTLTSWSTTQGGGFTYERSTPNN